MDILNTKQYTNELYNFINVNIDLNLIYLKLNNFIFI